MLGGADRPLADEMRAYGCGRIIPLDSDTARPEQLDYLDLLPTRRRGQACAPLSAVAERQGAALLCLVDARGEGSARGRSSPKENDGSR